MDITSYHYIDLGLLDLSLGIVIDSGKGATSSLYHIRFLKYINIFRDKTKESQRLRTSSIL
jgi:hypothetical protein